MAYKTPTQSRSRILVDSVIQATTEVLAGSGRVSMRSIAGRAGVGVGSIYDYFSNRDGLFDAVLDRVTEKNYNDLVAFLDERHDWPVPELIDALIVETDRVYRDQPQLTRALVLTIARFDKVELIQRERDRFSLQLAERLISAKPDSDPEEVRAVARVVIDMIVGAMISDSFRPVHSDLRAETLAVLRRVVATELGRL